MSSNPYLYSLTKELQKTQTTLKTFIGYPVNLDYDYAALSPFFHTFLNNIGDPFVKTNHSQLSSHRLERKIIHFLGKLYNLPKDERWGYVTHGGTEGNMYGIFLGRELYPNGILYFSQDTHYSITKIARLLQIPHEIIPSLANGEINYQELEKRIQSNKDKPVIICSNYGTTMKGAIDNVDTIITLLQNNNIKKYYLHIDAALFGMILPFIKKAPQINFAKPIDSVAISGYKFIGSPFPSGIVLTKKQYVKKIERTIEYVFKTLDTTITGSRSGHGTLLLWYAIQKKKHRGFQAEAETCLENANYLYNNLQKIAYPSQLNQFSNIVWFKKPKKKLINKWHLATQDNFSHVVVMQHVNKAKINTFLEDLIS